jgi:murein DD-endopeptidase MepM/ murein hydrolase activator NlpD
MSIQWMQTFAKTSTVVSSGLTVTALLAASILSSGCQARRQNAAELILSGSVAESKEVVELDPVFLARQKMVDTRFFGFASADEPLTATDEGEEDVDAPVVPTSVADVPGSFQGVALQWPRPGNITSPFGMRRGRLHAGIDIKGNKGDPIFAAADGQVLISRSKKAYGKVIVVGHAHDNQTLYAHLNAYAVREGQYVSRGDLVGYVGRTGRATGYHLHFETRVRGGIPQNPMKFLPRVVSESLQKGDATGLFSAAATAFTAGAIGETLR